MAIRTKLMLMFFLSAAVSIGAIVGIVSWEMRRDAVLQYESSLQSQLAQVNEYIESMLTLTSYNARYLADMPETKAVLGHLPVFLNRTQAEEIPRATLSPSAQAFDLRMEQMLKNQPLYCALGAGTIDGGFREYPNAVWPAGFDPRVRAWYKAALAAQGETATSKVYVTPQGNAVCSVAAKIHGENNETIGAAYTEIRLDTLVNLIADLKLGKTGTVMLVENTGVVIASPQFKESVFKNIASGTVAGLEHIMERPDGIYPITIGGVPRFVVVRSGYLGWKLLGIVDESELYASSNAVALQIVLIGVGLVILLQLCAFFLARSISNPIQLLVDASQRIAAGDLKALPDGRHFSGELRTLQESLVRMVGNLEQSLNIAESKSLEAAAQTEQAHRALEEAEEARHAGERAMAQGTIRTAKQLEDIVRRINSAASALLKEVEHAGNIARQQLQQASEAASRLDAISSTVAHAADSASRAATESGEARTQASSGAIVVRNVIRSIDEVQSVSHALDTSMQALDRQARDIGQIMGIISDIADQTNLLALNAAIEAARAGDAGRGFAVVADEVRKLAEKTMNATGNVSGGISAIQRDTRNSMEDLASVTRLVEGTTALAAEAGVALERIGSMVESSAGQISAVAAASEEQSSSTISVAHNAQELSDLANSLNGIMDDAALRVRELSDMALELHALIEELKREDS